MASINIKPPVPSIPPSEPTSPLTITTRTDLSFLLRLLQFLIKPIGSKLIAPKKELPAGSPKLTIHRTALKKCDITERQVEGIWLYDLTAKATGSTQTKDATKHTQPTRRKRNSRVHNQQQIYYFAGGGWQMPPSPEHWKLCAELCTRIPHTTITIISYPLAPNSPMKSSFPALEKLYPTLVSHPQDTEIVFAGDSAGGNIALALVLHMLSTSPSLRPPEKLLLVSPAVDLREQPQTQEPFAEELREADKVDPLLGIEFTNGTARNWCRDSDPTDPRASPLLADVAVLERRHVQVFGITAGNDVLAPPAVAFAEICRDLGVRGRWVDWRGTMHCFPLAWTYGIKESKKALAWMVEVLKE